MDDGIHEMQQESNRFKLIKNNHRLCTEEWKAWIPVLEQLSFHNCVQVLLWNVLTEQFIFGVDNRNVAGHDVALYLADDGADFSMSNFHPLFSAATLDLLQKGYEYLLYNKQKVYGTVLNFDFVYKRCNDAYMHCLLQSICIETDVSGNPLLILNYRHNITHIKKEKTTNLVITAPDEVQWWNYNFCTNAIEPVQSLSKQEKKVLRYLANGLSSTAISKSLFISPHTVDTHRRHLLQKTNCTDTTGMITYAKLVGLL